MSRLGRKPQGVGLVEPLEGSDHAKRRMMWFLETLSGERGVLEACAALDICESRFHAQRAAWLQESLALLEPRSPGRPPKPEPSAGPAEVASLRKQLQELEARAVAGEVQAELASVLPHVIQRLSPGKKTTRQPK
jgi:hypothetical protein